MITTVGVYVELAELDSASIAGLANNLMDQPKHSGVSLPAETLVVPYNVSCSSTFGAYNMPHQRQRSEVSKSPTVSEFMMSGLVVPPHSEVSKSTNTSPSSADRGSPSSEVSKSSANDDALSRLLAELL